MSMVGPLCQLLGIKPIRFSKEENILLEMDLLIFICHALKEFFRVCQKDYFQFMKFNLEMEDEMLEIEFMRLIINDILETEEYTLQGIATYTHLPEDILNELSYGINISPLSASLRKIIELHRSVRPELYKAIRKKLISEYLESEEPSTSQ